MTDLVTFRRLVRQRMGVPASDDFFTDAVLTDAVNEAIATVEEEHYWPWSERVEQVTANNGVLGKPDRWRATRGVFTAAGDELTGVARSDFMAYGTAAGPPSAWADSGTEIVIAPISTASLIHVYYRAPVPLVADDDQPDLPDSLSGAVTAKAAELLSAREDDQTARAAHGNDYAKWVQRMLRSQRRSTGPLKVRVRPGGWI
jgi:hypothetical protein